jgi:hypothetical protein
MIEVDYFFIAMDETLVSEPAAPDSTLGEGTSLPEPDRPLTRKELLASFQFSQGGPSMQVMIFRYLKQLHPGLTFEPENTEHLESESARPAEAITSNLARHQPVSAGGAGEAINRVLEIARSTPGIANAELLTRQEIIGALAEADLERDKHYLERPSGRNYESDGSEHYDPRKDSWRSDLCYFGFLGNTTGLPDFDQMFAEIASWWSDYLRNGPEV